MIRAKKSLGQNFLIDNNVIETIVNTIEIKDKSVLEVGPGTGNLTKFLLKKKPKKLFVVEKDDNLVSFLEKNLTNLSRQFLHAKTIGFIHPKKNKEMFFNSILPQDLENILKILRNTSK